MQDLCVNVLVKLVMRYIHIKKSWSDIHTIYCGMFIVIGLACGWFWIMIEATCFEALFLAPPLLIFFMAFFAFFMRLLEFNRFERFHIHSV